LPPINEFEEPGRTLRPNDKAFAVGTIDAKLAIMKSIRLGTATSATQPFSLT
jgi:hypothetical protein